MGERATVESNNRPSISLPPTLNQQQRYPWLVICDDEDGHQMFYNITLNRYFIRRIPELHNKIIGSSQQGWLFLKHNMANDCSIFNMFTLETRQLPPLNTGIDCHSSSVLSTPSTKIDESCRIIVIRDLFIHSCYLGGGEFDKRDLNWQENIFAAVKFGGKLYALSFFTYDLAVADFTDIELHFTLVFTGNKSLPQMLHITNDTKFYLIESCGELLFVYTNLIDHDGLDIQIYKADFDKKEWVEVKCLDDRTIFLDANKGLSSSSPGLRNNCVYYVKDGNLYMYDLKDGRTTEYDTKYDLNDRRIIKSLPCPSASKENSNENLSLFWVM